MAHLSQPGYQVPVPDVPESPTTCPTWCNPALHQHGWHVSDWRTWESEYTPRFELQLVRHDETGNDPYPDSIGQIDFNVRVVENVAAAVDADGFLLANELRELVAWLADLAVEADPHHLNGEPLEWHTERQGT